MSVQEMASGTGRAAEQEPRRIVEAEFKLPRMEKVTLPRVDTAPLRAAAEETLLVSIGVGVLLARGIGKAIQAARDEAAHEARPAVLQAIDARLAAE